MKAQLEQNRILMPPHSFTNFKMRKHFQNEPKFNGVYSGNNLSNTTYRVYIKTLGSIGTHWIPLYENKKNVTYFDSFGIGDIPKEIKKIHWKWIYYNEYNRIFIEHSIRLFIRIFIRFSNVWIFSYWIYWSHVKR